MKKVFLTIAIVLITIFTLSACTGGGPTVDQSWASNETLTYSMYDSLVNNGTTKVGSVSIVTTTNLTQEEKDKVSKADTKVIIEINKDNVCSIKTTYYTRVQNVLSLTREYDDLVDDNNDYTLSARHDDKNYVYDLTYTDTAKNKSGKINVGSSNYTDNEFLYFYIRCYDAESVPSSIKIADPFNDTSYELSCSYTSGAETIATETELGSVICNEITINRAESPVGTGIVAYYLPEKDEYKYGDYALIKSVKFPTKIVENNVSYVLNGFSASK